MRLQCCLFHRHDKKHQMLQLLKTLREIGIPLGRHSNASFPQQVRSLDLRVAYATHRRSAGSDGNSERNLVERNGAHFAVYCVLEIVK